MADSPTSASSPVVAPSPILTAHINTLFQATFTEIGLFIVVFLAVAESEGRWWWGTNWSIAVYMVLLLIAGTLLLLLHSPKPRSETQQARLYKWAWRAFCWANATIAVYLLVIWPFHMFYVYAWT